jgi:hypothetical protein
MYTTEKSKKLVMVVVQVGCIHIIDIQSSWGARRLREMAHCILEQAPDITKTHHQPF